MPERGWHKGEIGIALLQSNKIDDDGKINIRIRAEDQFINIRMTAENFAKTLTGRESNCEISIHKIGT